MMINQPSDGYPLLIRFSKTGLMRFVGHLDWQALQQAMFIRAGFKFHLGDGPTHKIKMKTSPPTPVGVDSLTELTCLLMDEVIYPDEAKRRLLEFCPEGVSILNVIDASFLARKNPYAAVEASMYSVFFGDDTPKPVMEKIVSEFEIIRSTGFPDGVEPEDVKKFWGRVLEIDASEPALSKGKIHLMVKQLEGDTFHGAQCAAYLEKRLDLPHYPIFAKLNYYRLTPSRRRLFQWRV